VVIRYVKVIGCVECKRGGLIERRKQPGAIGVPCVTGSDKSFPIVIYEPKYLVALRMADIHTSLRINGKVIA
jgi:hypothetical protein